MTGASFGLIIVFKKKHIIIIESNVKDPCGVRRIVKNLPFSSRDIVKGE
jgi:hypothetical protein